MKSYINKTIKLIKYVASVLFIMQLSFTATGDVIDPEKFIKKNGYQTEKMGDDKKTIFYSFTERAEKKRLTTLEAEIEKLPKHIDIQKICDFMRGGVKAKLIEKLGIAIDVAVTNYGYQGSTIACTLKYMHGSYVGTQLLYSKKGTSGMYMVFVTD